MLCGWLNLKHIFKHFCISIYLLHCHSRTNLLKFSFMNRIVGEWNLFPPDIRKASYVGRFLVEGF